jgi:cell division protein FtsB
MKAPTAVLALLLALVLMTGCGDLRQRAEQIESRIAAAEETAEIAERAAAQTAARIRALEDRVEALEDALDAVAEPGAEAAP